MRLYDTHCHFEAANRDEIRAILARARAAGVEKLMAVGGSEELNASAALAAEIAAEDAEGMPAVGVALGFDRDQVGLTTQLQASAFAPNGAMADKPSSKLQAPSTKHQAPTTNPPTTSPRAIGEIGLDYHYSPETRDAQRKLFGAQLEEARRRGLPVVIHTREADDDTLALLREIPSRGIIHCYTGTPEAARQFLDLGFYISFSGIVTFRLADNVRAAAAVVPDDRILIETDSPFLAPVPLRGSRNEPAFVRHTCEFLAALRGVAPDDFAALTFANAERAFQ